MDVAGINSTEAQRYYVVNSHQEDLVLDVGLSTPASWRWMNHCCFASIQPQAGSASTITLDASASATDNYYRGLLVHIISGTGSGQVRLITAYVGSTKVASIEPDWITAPDNISVFRLIFNGSVQLTDAGVASILTTQMTESYNADGAAPTMAQALMVIMQRLTDFSISGTSITVRKLDGSTEAFTLTMNDSFTASSRAARDGGIQSVGAIILMLFAGIQVPEWFQLMTGVIVGFWFGQRDQEQE